MSFRDINKRINTFYKALTPEELKAWRQKTNVYNDEARVKWQSISAQRMDGLMSCQEDLRSVGSNSSETGTRKRKGKVAIEDKKPLTPFFFYM